MFREYEEKRNRVAYLLPWGMVMEESIILNKNASLQCTFKFRGNDLDSCTKNELLVNTQRMNNALKRLNARWSFHVDVIRQKSKEYKRKSHANEIPGFLIELERETFFQSGHHYESEYYITLNYVLPSDNLKKVANIFFKKSDEEVKINTFQENLQDFKKEVESFYLLLKEVFKEIKILSTEETLTYYHSLISDSKFVVKEPKGADILLDSYITDCPLVGGLAPKLGKNFFKVVSVLNFPAETIPGILERLNKANIEYRWNTRYIKLDKPTAQKILSSVFKKWFGSTKSLGQVVKEILTKDKTANVNQDAINKSEQISREKTLIEEDSVGIGYYTTCIVLSDENMKALDDKCLYVKNALNALGFVAEVEDYNNLDAFFGTMPGNIVCNVRRPLLNTLTLSHLLPMNAIWAGHEHNKHLKEPALLYTQTTGNTPFRLNLHYGDVGHTLIVGPTGSGKSVLLTMLQAQFSGYKDYQIFAFDKGGSSRVLVNAMGGKFYDLGEDNIRFQPLAKCDDMKEREWCQEWLEEILINNENLTLTPEQKNYIWESLKATAMNAPELRTLSSFVNFLGGYDKSLKMAFSQYYGEGPYAKYFDGNSDFLEESNFVVFEMEKLSETRNAIAPALSYLFHKIETEKIIEGRPTIIPLDECWLFLDNPQFEAKIREWLKVLRKKNVSVIFATQSLSDIANSKIKTAVLDACYTRIYLANANAQEQQDLYKEFGLNDREIEIIRFSTPKRQYYYKGPEGSRLFELGLSPLELSYVAASSSEEQLKCKELVEQGLNIKEFNIEWLKFKGYTGEAEKLSGQIIVERALELIRQQKEKYEN